MARGSNSNKKKVDGVKPDAKVEEPIVENTDTKIEGAAVEGDDVESTIVEPQTDDTDVNDDVTPVAEGEDSESQDDSTVEQEPVGDSEEQKDNEGVDAKDTESEDDELQEVPVLEDEAAVLTLLESDEISFDQKMEAIKLQDGFLGIRIFIDTFKDYSRDMKDAPVNGNAHVNQLPKALTRALKEEDEVLSRIYLNIVNGFFSKSQDPKSAYSYAKLTRLSEAMSLSEEQITQTHMLYLALTKLSTGDRDVYVEAMTDANTVEKIKKFYNL